MCFSLTYSATPPHSSSSCLVPSLSELVYKHLLRPPHLKYPPSIVGLHHALTGRCCNDPRTKKSKLESHNTSPATPVGVPSRPSAPGILYQLPPSPPGHLVGPGSSHFLQLPPSLTTIPTPLDTNPHATDFTLIFFLYRADFDVIHSPTATGSFHSLLCSPMFLGRQTDRLKLTATHLKWLDTGKA